MKIAGSKWDGDGVIFTSPSREREFRGLLAAPGAA